MSTIASGEQFPVPIVEAAVFNGQPENFWLGRIALLDAAQQSQIFDGIALLRGNVYSELGYINSQLLDEYGRETDDDDLHSIHFTALERDVDNTAGHDAAKIVGTSRLIVKNTPTQKLPVERHFPEVFKHSPASLGSVEGSRLIANHADRRTQNKIGLALIRAMTHYSIINKIPADYGMAEEPLLRLFDASGIPTTIIGEPKEVRELGGVLYPIRIEVMQMVKSDLTEQMGKTALHNFFNNGFENLGEGFYHSDFIRR